MKLIDKDTLVAEIKKLEKLYCYDSVTTGGCVAKSVFISINDVFKSLEVKEVDLENIASVRWDDYVRKIGGEPDTARMLIKRNEYIEIAKCFFELGLKVSQKGE